MMNPCLPTRTWLGSGIWLVVVLSLIALAIAGCAPRQAAAPQSPVAQPPSQPSPAPGATPQAPAPQQPTETVKRGGTLTAAFFQDLTLADPHYAQGDIDNTMIRPLFESLVTLNANLEVMPMLAQSWSASEDGTVFRFSLRRGVKFHNGQEMKAADVKYSLDRFRASSPRKADLGMVTDVAVVDDYTVSVTLNGPSASFLGNLAHPFTVAIIPKDSAPAAGNITQPIGTGPFKLKEWLPGNRIVYSRFADYSPIDLPPSGLGGRKEALVDELVIRFIPNDQQTVNGMQTGELDFAMRVPAVDVDRLKATATRFSIVETPGVIPITVIFDHSDPIVSDVRFRQAVSHAIDKELVVEAAAWGRGTVTHSFTPKDDFSYVEDVHGRDFFPYNPDRARELLADMKYAGEKVTLLTSTEIQRVNGLAVQDQLKQVGINAEIWPVERAVYTGLIYNGGFQLLASNLAFRSDPYLRLVFWHCTRSSTKFGYCNPEYDRLLDEAIVTLDVDKRKELFRQAELIFKEDVITVLLYFQNNVYAVANRMKGFVPNPYNWMNFHNVWLSE